ncbi:PREDICTED: V-type proton ATPase subunit E-like isoform X2 [Prunus mume]|uniref:V-type proton ATPase subunit E-like isoform X2 n=1 Tax=Prunus mume TaxID=102107 RepID=A0ABM0PI26_PRUMU|nr:PREDICTED: V-type proton ATPase subunit E-like isoform X2 [Prunus mume]
MLSLLSKSNEWPLNPSDADVSKEIQHMVRFIRQEADEKANEIAVSAEEAHTGLRAKLDKEHLDLEVLRYMKATWMRRLKYWGEVIERREGAAEGNNELDKGGREGTVERDCELNKG